MSEQTSRGPHPSPRSLLQALKPAWSPAGRPAPWARIAPLIVLALSAGCSDGGTGPVDGVDLDRLFAPATAAETASVEADWASRNPASSQAEIQATIPIQLIPDTPAEARVYSHRVDGNEHFGIVVTPKGAPERSLPVIVYGHPGDNGVTLLELGILLSLLGSRADDYVIAAPSFRAETVDIGIRFQSTGEASPWDRDVDDAIAFLDLVLTETPAADPDRVAALGFSRGGGVALLLAIRDDRIRGVISIAGPTDFLSSYVRDITEDALAGTLRQLPGLEVLDARYIQPLSRGEVSIAQVRLELVRRSAAAFARSLPPVQIHHGDADDIVLVSQAGDLKRSTEAVVPARSGDEFFIYPGAGHNPLQMSGIGARVGAFLDSVFGD